MYADFTIFASYISPQAARVSYWCDQLKDLAPEIRGRVSAAYKYDSLLDLDSLLSYLQNIRLEVGVGWVWSSKGVGEVLL